MIDRALPHSLEAERAVLGAVLVDNAQLGAAQEVLTPGMFYRDAHRRIWEALVALDRRKSALDAVTLCEELARTGALEEVGGPAYIGALLDGVPRALNVAHYAQIVREKAALRRLILAGNRLINEAYAAEQDAGTVLAYAEELLLDISRDGIGSDGYIDAQRWMVDTMNTVARLAESPGFVTGLPTSLQKLDYMTRGFQATNYIILAARPSMGKTSLALQIALGAATHGSVGFLSLEMSREEIGFRALAVAARLNSYQLMTGKLHGDDYAKLAAAADQIAKTGFHIDDGARQNPGLIRSRAKRLAATSDLRLLVIDYIGLVDPTGVDAESRQQQIAVISRDVKHLAKELKIPILLLCQLNRAAETRADRRPQLADLRESGALEQDADVVLLIHRPEVYENPPKTPGLAELIVAKQRNGPLGTIKLRFIGQQTRFEPWEEETESVA